MKKNIKKSLALFIAAIMLLCSLPLAVSAVDTYTENGYTYTVSDGKATITDSDDTIKGNVTLPSTLGGYPVVAIGDKAFRGKDGAVSDDALTSVVIQEGVETIGESAFYSCSQLVSVSLPQSLKVIKSWAFAYCHSLTALVIPDAVTEIGYQSFRSCEGLSRVIIGSGVTSIGGTAFFGCGALKKVVIPANVTSIGDAAFGLEYETLSRYWYSDFAIEGYADTAAQSYATANNIPFSVHTHQDTNSDDVCDTCGASLKEPSALNDKTAKILTAVFEFIVFLVDAIIKLAQSSQGA